MRVMQSLEKFFPYTDMAFLHYRSAPFFWRDLNKLMDRHRFTIWPYHIWLHLKTQLVEEDIK